jgi:hypothetical protein
MDTAVCDPFFAQDQNYKLQIINNCRLYLGAIFVSDLAQQNTISPSKLDRSELAINSQVQRKPRLKPPPAAWKVWKEFIFRNYLVYPYTLMDPITNFTPPAPILRRDTEVQQLELLYANGHNTPLQDLVNKLPTHLRHLLGTITYPQDNGASIAEHIRNGTAVGASDGSVINGFDTLYGGYASSIQQENSTNNSFTQYAPSPHSTKLTSTTTEIYGYIAATLMVHLVCITHRITTGACEIYIDNQEAGKRGDEDPHLLNISDFLSADYDISALLRQLTIATPIHVQHRWVQSHQDELPNGAKIFGPFSRPIQLNQMVDALAAQGRNQAQHDIITKPTFSTTMLQLYTPTGVAIDDFGKYLLDTRNGNAMKAYYLERRGWDNEHLCHIDWEGISLFLNATKHTRRMKVLQFQHGWQNTGYQKLQFLLSAETDDAPVTEEMKESKAVYCPFKCGEIESCMHYMSCRTDTMSNFRNTLRQKVLNRLTRYGTSPMLVSILGHALTEMEQDRTPTLLPEWTHMEHQNDVNELINSQTSIGWPALLQGFVSTQWGHIQRRHLRNNPRVYDTSQGKKQTKTNTIEVWKRRFITEIINYSIDCWQHRNDKLHGALERKGARELRKELTKGVRQLYSESRQLTHDRDTRIFRMPCRLRVKQHTPQLQLWIATATQTIKHHNDALRRGTLDDWLDRTSLVGPQQGTTTRTHEHNDGNDRGTARQAGRGTAQACNMNTRNAARTQSAATGSPIERRRVTQSP